MKNKIIGSLLIASVLSVGAFAQNHYDKNDSKSSSICKSDKKNNHYKMKRGHNRGGILHLVKKLNLDDSQKTKIKSIMNQRNTNEKTIASSFTSSSFDKNKYIDIIKDKKENMLKLRADKIEKVYNILNSKQKTQLKVLIDLKAEKKGKHFDKRFNGRG